MEKKIVVYYSRKGSNKYLANKVAEALQCDIIFLEPRLKSFFFLVLSSLLKLSLGNKSVNCSFNDYKSIILCGPIWMGQFISPLYDFVNKNKHNIQELSFITCCGSTDETKEDKFGYAHVFKKIKSILGKKCMQFEAFPIKLVLPEDKKDNDESIMNTRLSDSNFCGEIKTRFDNFIQKL